MKNLLKNNWLPIFIFSFVLLHNCKKIPEHQNKENRNIVKTQITTKYIKTIATLLPENGKVTINGTVQNTLFRLTPDSIIETKAQTIINSDSGALILADSGCKFKINENYVELQKGRIWINTQNNTFFELKSALGTIQSTSGKFDANLKNNKLKLHIIEGTPSFTSPKKQKSVLDSGAYEIDENFTVKNIPTELWIDWTGGIAKKQKSEIGYGVLVGVSSYYSSEISNYNLILRSHKTEVKIRRNLAITSVKQVFFNPSSTSSNGKYKVKIPQNAIITEVSIKNGKNNDIQGEVLPLKKYLFSTDKNIYLVGLGKGEYYASIPHLPPSGEIKISFKYVESLNRNKHYIYKYIMKGAAKSSDFYLGLRVLDYDSKLKAGLGGKWNKHKFEIYKNDFKPTSDFVVEIIPSEIPLPTVTKFKKTDDKTPLMFSIPTNFLTQNLKTTISADKTNLVFILDLSSSMDSIQSQILKTSMASLLEKMNNSYNIEVLILRNNVFPLDTKGLAPLTTKRKSKLIENLSKIEPNGATNLSKALQKASVDIPYGNGVIIYIGDGQPTKGKILPYELKESLAFSSPEPLFKAILIGKNNYSRTLDFLGEVFNADNTYELSEILNKIVQNEYRASFKNLKIILPPKIKKITPTVLLPVSNNDTLYIYGFTKNSIPKTIDIKGFYKGYSFSETVKLKVYYSEQTNEFKKLYAISKIKDLKYRGAGYEAVIRVAKNANIITAGTGMSFINTGFQIKSIKVPYSLWENLPKIPKYIHKLLKNQPYVNQWGSSLPNINHPYTTSFNFKQYYSKLLENSKRKNAVNECYNRRAAFGIVTGGYITFDLEINGKGKFTKIEKSDSSIKDKKLIVCISNVLKLMPPFPAPPERDTLAFSHTYSFKSTGQILPQKCSETSKKFIGIKRKVWLRRLLDNNVLRANKASKEWYKAKAMCELSSLTDKRTMLDIIINNLTFTEKLSFSALLNTENYNIKKYIKEKIHRSIKNENEAEQFVKVYSLWGGSLFDMMLSLTSNWYGDKGKDLDKSTLYKQLLTKVEKYYKLDPTNAQITLFYAKVALKADAKSLVETLLDTLVNRTDLTEGQQDVLADLLFKLGKKQQATLVISNSVEFAPFSPYIRKKSGDFFKKTGMLRDALAEYKFLNYLLPQFDAGKILLSDIYSILGSTEKSLNLLENIILSRKNEIAKNLIILRLVQLSKTANQVEKKKIRARARIDGLLTETGKNVFFLKQISGQPFEAEYAVKTNNSELKDLTWRKFPVSDLMLKLKIFKTIQSKDLLIFRFYIKTKSFLDILDEPIFNFTIISNLWKQKQKVFEQKYNVKYRKYLIITHKNNNFTFKYQDFPNTKQEKDKKDKKNRRKRRRR